MRGMSLIVKTVSALVSAFALLFGLHVVFYGHASPGGGFAGGVILACCFILMVLAFGRSFVDRFIGQRVPSVCGSIGALAFLFIALAGYTAGHFLSNFLVPAAKAYGGTILACDVAIAVLVASCLFGVFAAFAVFRPEE